MPPVMSTLSRRYDFLAIAAAVATALALELGPPKPWPQVSAFLLLIFLPTVTWSRSHSGFLVERVLLGGATVLALNMLMTLLLVYLPGPVPRIWQVALQLAVVALPVSISPGKAVSAPDSGPRVPQALVLAILTVLLMRLPGLGYSEFQGDEGVIMVRAAAVITGDDTELFLHQKGPAEILIPLAFWNLAGTITEFWARLSFAWASGLSMLAVIVLTRRWSGRNEGLIAGLLFALAGFSVAFGRIVQYQSLVMLWSSSCVFAAVRYRQQGRNQDLLLSAVFLASGLLAHYDAILVAPAVIWALLGRIRQERNTEWIPMASAMAVGAVILGVFYLPFALNPNFARTGKYLLQARLGAGQGNSLISWSGPAVWRMLTFYNSTYYIILLVMLVLFSLVVLVRRRTSLGPILLLLVPVLFYLFIVKDPRTHVYTFFPGASILAAVGVVEIGKLTRRAPHYKYFGASVVGILLLVLLSVYYVFLMFLDHAPERQRTWAENRPFGFPTTWDEPPRYGLFGFPHQAGWRVLAELLPVSAYPYASNEEEEITNWYMSQAPRTHCSNFQTFILAEDVQDQIPYEDSWHESSFLQYQIMIGRPAELADLRPRTGERREDARCGRQYPLGCSG